MLEAIASVELVCVLWRKCKEIDRWQVLCEVRAVLRQNPPMESIEMILD